MEKVIDVLKVVVDMMWAIMCPYAFVERAIADGCDCVMMR